MNGWCVSLIGHSNSILVGWYRNNKRNGNWLLIDGDTQKIRESGFYKDDAFVEEMKDHHEYTNFDVDKIFLK